MRITHLGFRNYTERPWKNGKGQSREIASLADPKGNMLWNVSLAEVKEPGPFSDYSGYHRLLTLVEGSSLNLKSESRAATEILTPGRVFSFSGAEKIQSILPSGTVLDLGVISKEGAFVVEMNVPEILQKPRSFLFQSKTTLLVCLQGALKATVYPGEKKVNLKPLDTLRVDQETDLESGEEALVLLEPKIEESAQGSTVHKIAWIEISPTPASGGPSFVA